MSALEREIIEKFHQLDKDAKMRVRELIEQEIAPLESPTIPAFDYDSWFRDVKNLRQQIRNTQETPQSSIDVIGVLRGIRDGEDE